MRNRSRKSGTGAGVSLSKTLKMVQQQQALSGFIRFDLQYLFPLFTHRFSRNEVRECRVQMSNLATQWQQAVRSSPVAASASVSQHLAGSTTQLNNEENNNSD